MPARTTRRMAAPELPAPEFLTDPQGAALVNLGITRFQEVQKEDPTFPRPVWLGERGKRHVRGELLSWALGKRRRGTISGAAT